MVSRLFSAAPHVFNYFFKIIDGRNHGKASEIVPAMTSPPMFGLTASKISAVLMVSCPIMSERGMSSLVLDSVVTCNYNYRNE